MAMGDVYELVHVQRLLGQEVLNTYYYEQRNAVVVVGETVALALADQWYAQHLHSILQIQGPDCVTTGVRVKNLFDLADFGERLSSDPGQWAGGGNTDAAFTAVAFKETLDTRAVGAGAKRIAGVTTDVSLDGVLTNGTFITAANTAAGILGSPVTNGAIIPIDTWYPVVVKRVRSGTPHAYHYRLPAVLAEKILGNIASVAVNLILSSQVSRKIGRGA